MRLSKLPALLVLPLLLLAGCVTTDPAKRPPALSGMIRYTVNVPLPADSAIDIVLLDTRNTADPADDRIVAQRRMSDPGSLPVRYRLPFDPESVDTGSLHRVEARVYIADQLVFDTRGTIPALSRRSGLRVDIPVGQPESVTGGQPPGRDG